MAFKTGKKKVFASILAGFMGMACLAAPHFNVQSSKDLAAASVGENQSFLSATTLAHKSNITVDGSAVYISFAKITVASGSKMDTFNGSVHTTTKSIDWLVPFGVKSRVSSTFGPRGAISGVPDASRNHGGVDIGIPTDVPIIAARDGVASVYYATSNHTAGNFVNIDHGDGYISRYLHMTHHVVSSGQTVKAGQVIGYIGSTGASSGSHLHYGIQYGGVAINPNQFLGLDETFRL